MDKLPSFSIDISSPLPPFHFPGAGKFTFDGHSFPFNSKTILQKKILGEGKTGLVFRYEFLPLKIDFALKVVRISSNNEIQSVLKEAHALQELDHPNVICCYGYYLSKDQKQAKIALEFMDCGSLQNLIDCKHAIPELYASYIARHVLQGIDYVHRNKYYHRDIKPSNILLNRLGQIKLADFGTSKKVALTNEFVNSGVGTVRYFSFERLAAKSYTQDADLWSFGLTLLQCVLGKYPIDLAQDSCFMDFISKVENFDIESYKSKISPALRNFLEICLAHDPVNRVSVQTLLKTEFIEIYRSVDSNAFAKWIFQ